MVLGKGMVHLPGEARGVLRAGIGEGEHEGVLGPLVFFAFAFWLCCMACRILVLQ